MAWPTSSTVLASSGAFQPPTDPKRLWLSGPFAEGLTQLHAAITGDHGVFLLMGDVGLGKTMLTKALEERLATEGVRVGRLHAGLPLDFHAAVAETFSLGTRLPMAEAFVEEFAHCLDEAGARGERVVLVVDEAHSLSPPLWAEIRRLLEVNAPKAGAGGVFSVLLVGQNRLEAILREPDNAAVRSRIKIRCRLAALKADEVAAYCVHRLDSAGLGSSYLTPEALREVAAVSGGIPRLIDLICEQALAVANLRGLPSVEAALVRECAQQTLALAVVNATHMKGGAEQSLALTDFRRMSQGGAERSVGRWSGPPEGLVRLALLAIARTMGEWSAWPAGVAALAVERTVRWSRVGAGQIRLALLAIAGTVREWRRAVVSQTKVAGRAVERIVRPWRRAGAGRIRIALVAIARTVRHWSEAGAGQATLALVTLNQRSHTGAMQTRLALLTARQLFSARAARIWLAGLAVVGLAGVTVIVVGYGYRLRQDARHPSAPLEVVAPSIEARGNEPLVVRPTMEAPSLGVPGAVLPQVAGTEPPPGPPERQPLRPSLPSSAVDGPKEASRPGRAISTPAVAAPRQPAPSETRPIGRIRPEEQDDPGAIIDWLLKGVPRPGN